MNRIEWRNGLLSALLGFLLFAVTFDVPPIYDDVAILSDPRLGDVSRWHLFLTESYNGGLDNLWRPLVSMSFALQWQAHVHWEWPRDLPMRLVNVLLHAAVSFLAAVLCTRLAERSASSDGARVGLIGGLLFAAHPIHSEAVAGLVGRAELLCALGVFGVLVLLLRELTVRRAVWAYVWFVIALLSKEQGLLTPLIAVTMLAALAWARGSRLREMLAVRHDVRVAGLFVAAMGTLAVYVIWRESHLRFGWSAALLDYGIQPLARPDADRLGPALAIAGRYFQLLVFPHTLSIDYGWDIIGHRTRWEDPFVYLGMTAVLLWAWLTIAAVRRRDGVMLAGLLGFAILYGLVGNILRVIGTIMGERLMYIPSLFFILVVCLLLVRLPAKAVIAVTLVLLLLASARTVTYAARWTDRLAFYQYQEQVQPRSTQIKLLLAGELRTRGRLDEADAVVGRAIELAPGYEAVWIQAALAAADRNDFGRAGTMLDRARRLRPGGAVATARELIDNMRDAAARRTTQPATQTAPP